MKKRYPLFILITFTICLLTAACAPAEKTIRPINFHAQLQDLPVLLHEPPFPWKSVGWISMDNAPLYRGCVGTLVGKRLVLTTARCALLAGNTANGKKSLLFSLMDETDPLPIASRIQHIHMPEMTRNIETLLRISPRHIRHNWAILVLRNPIGVEQGYFDVMRIQDTALRSHEAVASFYLSSIDPRKNYAPDDDPLKPHFMPYFWYETIHVEQFTDAQENRSLAIEKEITDVDREHAQSESRMAAVDGPYLKITGRHDKRWAPGMPIWFIHNDRAFLLGITVSTEAFPLSSRGKHKHRTAIAIADDFIRTIIELRSFYE